MAYDSKTYGSSPFGNAATTTAKKPPRKTPRPRRYQEAEPDEALSDQIGDQTEAPATETEGAEADTPALPASYAPEANAAIRSSLLSPFPKGASPDST